MFVWNSVVCFVGVLYFLGTYKVKEKTPQFKISWVGFYLRKRISLFCIESSILCNIFYTKHFGEERKWEYVLPKLYRVFYIFIHAYIIHIWTLFAIVYIWLIVALKTSLSYAMKNKFSKELDTIFFSTSIHNVVICYSYFSYNSKLFLSSFIRFFFM